MNFQEKLNNIIKKNNSLVCIGLDSDIDKIPKHLLKEKDSVFEFNKAIIDKTPRSCPLCKKNIPINTTVGHGKKYMESLKAA